MKPRSIIITGANGGLGQAIARAFLDESESNLLWLGIHQKRDQAERLAEQYPDRCHCLDLDVTQARSWREAVSTVMQNGGRIDVLIHAAGKHQDALLATMPLEAWSEVISSSLEGAFHGCQAVLPAMVVQRSGRIVHISSLSALYSPPGQANYAAAKAGLIGLTQSLAKEVARLNITVNAICPGFIETEALAGMTAEERSTAIAKVPMRRFGRPEEVAAAVLFLASDKASYITGSLLKIDGGIF